MRDGGVFKKELNPAVIVGVIVVVLGLFGWFIYSRTELSGAKNPVGAPGNVDPHLGGPNSVLKSSVANKGKSESPK